MPNIRGGYQPDTRAPSSRRADFDLLRRIARLDPTIAALEARIVELEEQMVLALTSVSAHLSFTFNSNLAAPPVGNQIRLNSASQTAATTMWVSRTTVEGLDVAVGLARVRSGWWAYIQDFDDSTKWVRYDIVGAPVNHTSYWAFPVAFDSGPANVPFQKIEIQFVNPGVVT